MASWCWTSRPGMTSNAALQRVKGIYFAQKAGHTGSLDPLATGVLPICFGEATKWSQFLLDSDKEYLTTVCLGVTTDTGDADGTVLEERSAADVDVGGDRRGAPALSRRDRAGAADVLGAEAQRCAAVRIRTRGPGGGTRGATHHRV
jgi:hypothetical protein